MWKQKPLAEISLGEASELVSSVLLTSRSLEASKPPCSTVLKRWTLAPSPQCLDMQTAVLTEDTNQLHCTPLCWQASVVPATGNKSSREHLRGCSALSYSTGRERTVTMAKEQVQNFLSRPSDSQLLPKERSLARKGKARNWV